MSVLFKFLRKDLTDEKLSRDLRIWLDRAVSVGELSWQVFRIHDILVWIRILIRGSMPLTNGSGSGCGSGSFYFHHWPSRCQQKTNKKKVFLHITFLRNLYIIFKDKKSKRCHKTVEIKVFLTIFAYWWKDPDPDPEQDPDPDPSGSGRPKNTWIRWIRIRNTDGDTYFCCCSADILGWKGPKHENFSSEFFLTLSKLFWMGNVWTGKTNFLTLAKFVLSACSVCSWCFYAHAQHVLNDLKLMHSMLLMILSACWACAWSTN